ncbi:MULTISPECIES: hypothetical protein [unclassified Kribbella]|uniref:hypothetical protein n=1 Tax=unclassified Kribbella TaxID=2644121 RepID=UPI0033E9D841
MSARRPTAVQKVSGLTLTGMVVGSMVGGGVFTLPREFGEAVVVASAVVWAFHVLIARGVRQAAVVNRIVTIAKLLPILTFIVIVAPAFEAGTFADNFWGGDERFLARDNVHGTPIAALLSTTAAVQLFLFLVLLVDDALDFMLKLDTVAVVYSIFMLHAAGPKYLLLAAIVYAPGTLLYLVARREQSLRVFNRAEVVACAVLMIAAALGVVLIATDSLDV